MKSDAELKHDVENELRLEPSTSSIHIEVRVASGIVTLSGHVHRLAEKLEVEKVVKRLHAVKGVVNELDVRHPGGLVRTDEDIAVACENAIDCYYCIPKDKVKVSVLDGWVTLEGEVEWSFQKDDAAAAIRTLTGVCGVNNNLTVKQHFDPVDVKSRIVDAFRRCPDLDANQVQIEARNGAVILSGRVSTSREKDDAQRAAYSVVGVIAVDNQICVLSHPTNPTAEELCH